MKEASGSIKEVGVSINNVSAGVTSRDGEPPEAVEVKHIIGIYVANPLGLERAQSGIDGPIHVSGGYLQDRNGPSLANRQR